MDVTFRKYQQGDEESLVTLCKAVYGSSSTKEYWRWKYFDHLSDVNASYVAVSEDKVVGMAGIIPYRIKIGDREMVGGQGADLMSHPKWRKRNVFLPLLRSVHNDLKKQTDIHYGFTNDLSFRIYVKRFKYDVAFRVPRLDRVVSVGAFLRRTFRKGNFFARIIGSLGDVFSRYILHPRMPHLDEETELRENNEFDERFDLLWDKLKGLSAITTIRDSKYLSWRYGNHPLFKYRTFVAERRGELIGFIILRCNEEKGLKRGYIMDLWAEPEKKDILTALLALSMRFFRAEKVDLVTIWMLQHSPYYHLFTKYLFFKRTSDLIVLTKSFHKDISNEFLSNPSNWYLTMGDCDSF